MNYHALLKKVEDHVKLFYREHIDERLLFHNLLHARDVADAAKKIAAHYKLDDRSLFIVCAAAWFHDTGYLATREELHELKSAELAELFLKSTEAGDEEIAEIKKCILATKKPQMPGSLLEKIICDADLFYFGTDEFKEKRKLLKKETEAVKNIKIDGNEWRAVNIKMLEMHNYHTDYCSSQLNKIKAENLYRLKTKQQEKLPGYTPDAGPDITDINKPDNNINSTEDKNIIKAGKKDRPERGIETMFRIAASNNVRISEMADNKAHIMISVNSIIMSVTFGLIIANLNQHRNLLIPTVILLVVNVFTIIYSVLATMPKISNGVFTPEQVENKSVNLLYFGSYYKMNFAEYNLAIKQVMNDREFLYGNLTKDIFWQGKVLGRKYRLLRISYLIFMYGIIASVIAFAVGGFF